MSGINLYGYQLDAVKRMKSGCILAGGVGSGKSRTALAYYYLTQGGELDTEQYYPMDDPPKDLYIITTARKRDTFEWMDEMAYFLLSPDKEVNTYQNTVVVDSWNNIKKYAEVKNAFFIFDEQRVVGSGAWVKAFLKIAKHNHWILLSATPGDTWMDYVPVFIANGFYKNRSEFVREHVVYSRYSKFPQVDHYINTGRLLKQRNAILIHMDFKRETVAHHEDIFTAHDVTIYKAAMSKRWNIWTDKPMKNAAELCYCLRRIVNTDESRLKAVADILREHPKAIIFYNFDYELTLLEEQAREEKIKCAEYNGHKHDAVPEGKRWIYLVQYTAGAEGWNCISTDTIIFYSQNYSYKVMLQASGRIDRLNTPYHDLYYYHLKSHSPIDLAIARALKEKKKFNETKYVGKFETKKTIKERKR